jgi:hypothetical protein
VTDGELLGGDDALGLVADVQEDLIAVDPNDRPAQQIAFVEVLEGGLDGLNQLFGGEVAFCLRLGTAFDS